MSSNDEAFYDYDETHPIPNLDVIDVNGIRRGGGSDLVIVIAEPLAAEERSLRRLHKKVEVYLGFIQSEQFQAEAGVPNPENTKIIVKIHRESCSEAFELLIRNKGWALDNNATLEIDPCFPEATA